MGVLTGLWKNFVGGVCSQHIVFGEGREYAGREGGGLKRMAFQRKLIMKGGEGVYEAHYRMDPNIVSCFGLRGL